MMLSKKTRYAIVALARLAREYGKGPMQIREIAEEEKIPQSFLENILLELKKRDTGQQPWESRRILFIKKTGRSKPCRSCSSF
jgi:hypothetical protein